MKKSLRPDISIERVDIVRLCGDDDPVLFNAIICRTQLQLVVGDYGFLGDFIVTPRHPQILNLWRNRWGKATRAKRKN